MSNQEYKQSNIQWPDRFRGQLMYLDGKYWGLKMYKAAPGEYRIANVIVPDPDREQQGVLIKEMPDV